MSSQDLRRFPLKTVFKRIFRDTDVDFQTCLWLEYLHKTCNAPLETLFDADLKVPRLSPLDWWSKENVLNHGVDVLVQSCLTPANEAPGVLKWVQALYNPKKVFSMIRAMIKVFYSVCIPARKGLTALRSSFSKKYFKDADGKGRMNFYQVYPVFSGWDTKSNRMSNEHRLWLAQIDECFWRCSGCGIFNYGVKCSICASEAISKVFRNKQETNNQK